MILVGAVALLSAGAVLASFESFFLTALSLVFLMVSVSPFLFPTRYTITDVDVSEKRLWRDRSRRFRDLRRLEVGVHGALLSPFARKSWLDRHRGVLLRFDGCDRQAVVAILRERMGEGEGVGDSDSDHDAAGRGAAR